MSTRGEVQLEFVVVIFQVCLYIFRSLQVGLKMVYNSRINPIRLSFPQNYKTLSVHPNMSKGKILYARVNTVLYRFIAGETFSRCVAEWRNIVLGLGDVGDFEAVLLVLVLMCIRITNDQFTTIAPILANPC
jgi:hypothetical protein